MKKRTHILWLQLKKTKNIKSVSSASFICSVLVTTGFVRMFSTGKGKKCGYYAPLSLGFFFPSSLDGLDHLSVCSALSLHWIFQQSSRWGGDGVWEEDRWAISLDGACFHERVKPGWGETLIEYLIPNLLWSFILLSFWSCFSIMLYFSYSFSMAEQLLIEST